MIKHIALSFVIIVLFADIIKSQEAPKNIIVIDENLDNEETLPNERQAEDVDNSQLNEEPVTDDIYSDKNEIIVVDDIPKDFNEWYGVLSSEDGGLGWSMWGNTSYSYSLALLKETYFNTNSSVLFNLTSRLLLSRAEKPTYNNSSKDTTDNSDQFIFFREKIKILSQLGATDEIRKLIDGIPLEFKDKNFDKTLIELRNNIMDIPFLCQNVLRKNFDPVKDIEKRKTLIACNVALKKFDEARLAMDLLENDSEGSYAYTEHIRKLLDPSKIKKANDYTEKFAKNLNMKIISLSNYEMAKNIFIHDKKALDKIIYDMKLYDQSLQIESLERLVQFGIYDFDVLKEAYVSFYDQTINAGDNANKEDIYKQNSVFVRSKLYFLINNSSSQIDRAKYLNLLWTKAYEINIQRAVYKVTVNALASIVPNQELSWFIYPATQALIISNNFKEARNWLFFMSDDLYNRAALDIDFCKYLIILYINDSDLMDINIKIPDLDYLLSRLNSSPEINKQDFFKILVTLKALEKKFSKSLWDNFYLKNTFNNKGDNNARLNNIYFHLDEAVKYNNLAETTLISLNILNNKEKNVFDYYSLYKPLNALFKLGLKKTVRDFATEYNLNFLN